MPLIVTTCFKQSHHWIFSDMNLPAYLCFFTTINMTNLQKEKSNYYLHPTKNHTPQQKRATCFAHCCKTSWITRFTTHENKPVLHQIRSLKAAKWFSRKQQEVLLFPTKSVHVARFTVYGLDGINLPRLPLTASLWIRCNISSMRRSVSSPDETPRRELKIRRAAEYFWRTSRCFIWWWNTVSNAWYYFSNKMILEGEIKDAKLSSFSSDFQMHSLNILNFLCIFFMNY